MLRGGSKAAQLCITSSAVSRAFARFGTPFSTTCALELTSRDLESVQPLRFYELFIVDDAQQLYPIPVGTYCASRAAVLCVRSVILLAKRVLCMRMCVYILSGLVGAAGNDLFPTGFEP